MRLKADFKLVDIADEHIVVPVGEEAALFRGVVTVSGAAFFLLNNLSQPKTKEEIVCLLMQEYELDSNTANKDVDDFVENLFDMGVLEK